MLADLLINSKKPHTLRDDRESSLHVLTWTALRYFQQFMLPSAYLLWYLIPFDEVCYASSTSGPRGGSLKKAFMLGRNLSQNVEFVGQPQLDALIKELTDTFAVRYEAPPSEEDHTPLASLRRADIDERMQALAA